MPAYTSKYTYTGPSSILRFNSKRFKRPSIRAAGTKIFTVIISNVELFPPNKTKYLFKTPPHPRMEKREKTDEFSRCNNAWKLVARFKPVHCVGEQGRLARERAQKFSIGGVKKHLH